MNENEKVYTVSEVAEALRVTEYTVREKLRSGELRGFKITSHWRIPESALKEFIEKGRLDDVE